LQLPVSKKSIHPATGTKFQNTSKKSSECPWYTY